MLLYIEQINYKYRYLVLLDPRNCRLKTSVKVLVPLVQIYLLQINIVFPLNYIQYLIVISFPLFIFKSIRVRRSITFRSLRIYLDPSNINGYIRSSSPLILSSYKSIRKITLRSIKSQISKPKMIFSKPKLLPLS